MHTLSQTNTSFRGSRSIGTASRSSTECKDAARSTCHISFCEWSHEISRDVAGEVWEFEPMFPVAHCWIPLCLDHPLSILYQSSINMSTTAQIKLHCKSVANLYCKLCKPCETNAASVIGWRLARAPLNPNGDHSWPPRSWRTVQSNGQRIQREPPEMAARSQVSKCEGFACECLFQSSSGLSKKHSKMSIGHHEFWAQSFKIRVSKYLFVVLFVLKGLALCLLVKGKWQTLHCALGAAKQSHRQSLSPNGPPQMQHVRLHFTAKVQ